MSSNQTSRPVSPLLEEMMPTPRRVLDHGFVRLVDYMGNDEAIVQAARVSYGKGTKKRTEDNGLLRYLMRHRHTTPFEMCEVKFHVKLPIFVARQWIRHRTASVNEMSARYSILDNEFYLPTPEVIAEQSNNNKQGRGEVFTPKDAQNILAILQNDATTNYDHYVWMLNEKNGEKIAQDRAGLARELARMNLTLNTYTQWYWKCNLHNLFNFLSLRADSHAQMEIRAYAEAIMVFVAAWVPQAYKAFLDYRLNAVTFSDEQMRIIRTSLDLSALNETLNNTSLSKREVEELLSALALNTEKT